MIEVRVLSVPGDRRRSVSGHGRLFPVKGETAEEFSQPGGEGSGAQEKILRTVTEVERYQELTDRIFS